MGSVFGGGGGGGGGPAPDTTTQFIREAPGIEERKLELMDIARQTAQSPISIPDIQVQGLSPLEQAAITQAGQTGVGAGAVQQAIQLEPKQQWELLIFHNFTILINPMC
jgi:hypothetical protein